MLIEVQIGVAPPGNGETPNRRECANRNTTKISSASQNRQPRLSPMLRVLRPATAAANGTFEVLAAKASQADPSLRRSFASMENVPSSAVTKKVPKKITEARSPLASR